MIIRQAKISDIKSIMLMYKSCVSGMLENNITQWDKSYPNLEIIKLDVKRETYFVAEEENIIIGGINIDQNQDPKYLSVTWGDSSKDYLVVHRLAVKYDFWNKKIGLKYYYNSYAYQTICQYKANFNNFEWWTGREWSTDKDLYRNIMAKDDTIKTLEDLHKWQKQYFEVMKIK